MGLRSSPGEDNYGWLHRRSGTEGTSYFIQGGYFGENTILKLLSFGGKQRTGIAWNGLSPKEEAVYGRRYNSAGHMNPGSAPQDARYRYNTDNYEQYHYQAQLTQRLSEGLILNLTAHYTKGYGFTDEYRTGRKLKEYGLKEFILRDESGAAILDKDGKEQKVKKITLLAPSTLTMISQGVSRRSTISPIVWSSPLGYQPTTIRATTTASAFPSLPTLTL